jgi:choline-glycine betaine transporter
MALSRRNLLYLFGVDVVLFVLANVTSGSSKHPGTVSNVFWYVFLIGLLALIVLGVVALVLHLRPRTTSG